MTSISKTWEDRILSGTFTKAQCNQWAQAVWRLANGLEPGGKKTNLTAEEASSLLDLLQSCGGVRLTAEHTAQGKRWVERYASKTFGLSKDEVADVIVRFSHFSYQGGAVPSGWRRAIPIWHIHLTDGAEIAYCNSAWTASAFDGHPTTAWQWLRVSA